jgi:hypothetical protein
VRVMEVLEGERSDVVAAQICMFPNPHAAGAQRIRALRDKIRAVKQLNLNCVELRACNTGRSEGNI